MLGSIGSLLAGRAVWPLLEYVIHRFYEHHPEDDTRGAAYHIDHHRRPEGYNEGDIWSVTADFQAELVPAGLGFFLILVPVLGGKKAFLFSCGVLWGLAEYGVYHLQAHQGGPANAFDEKMMKHHLAHHFRTPKKNFGVTTDFFDRLFGTWEKVDLVPVPATMAPKWLKQNPEKWKKDYKVLGRSFLQDN